MPGLVFSLQGEDLGRLRIIAELWGIPLEGKDFQSGLEELLLPLSTQTVVVQAFNDLVDAEREALLEILRNGGRMPWPAFSRSYGTVREMGAARRDREKPYRDPSASVAERLWYRGWIARSFFNTPEGILEFVYIPDEFRQLIPYRAEQRRFAGLELSPTISERLKAKSFSGDDILEDLTTCLAAMRSGLPLESVSPFLVLSHHPIPIQPNILSDLCACLGILGVDGISVDNARNFLESTRDEAMQTLFRGWRNCKRFNELSYVPDLELEGAWSNDPVQARNFMLRVLREISQEIGSSESEKLPWWNVTALIDHIHQHDADFQRPEGDYDSWHIRRVSTGEYLRGFQHWIDVEGRLIRFLLGGVFFWLGLVDIAFSDPAAPDALLSLTAVRLNPVGAKLLQGEKLHRFQDATTAMTINHEGMVCIPLRSPRHIRYQLARFSELQEFNGREYLYSVTPSSLQRAGRQGLKVSHLISLLQKNTQKMPPHWLKALHRWERFGTEVYLRSVEILEVKHERVLQEIMKTRASRYIIRSLNPTTALIKPGSRLKVLSELYALGLLGEVCDE